jgi:hypothetical protein
MLSLMPDGIIQRVFDKKIKYMADYYTTFVIEELKHELVLEIDKELSSQPFSKSPQLSMLRQWLIGDG